MIDVDDRVDLIFFGIVIIDRKENIVFLPHEFFSGYSAAYRAACWVGKIRQNLIASIASYVNNLYSV